MSGLEIGGKVALVTGATKGIGYAAALALARAGADVAVISRTPDDCERVAAEIRALGRRAVGYACDVSDGRAVAVMVEDVAASLGRVDILVNNAGMAVTKAAVDITEAEWDRVINVNLKSVFLLSQAAGKLMIAQGSGKIINMASMFGMVGEKRILPYLASKGGVIQMTRGLALEWARYNIQVNAIAPGYIETDINQRELREEKIYQHIMGKTPARRFGTAEEVASAVLYLASPAADFITGSVLGIDGGWTAQ